MDNRIKNKLDHLNPFNIEMQNLKKSGKYKLLKPVTSANMFTGGNQELHPEGLWSNEIFGKMGTPERMKTPGYMELGIEIIHPLVYLQIASASRLCVDIMSGERYARFNPTTNFFEESNALEGSTGMHFFLSNWAKFTLPESGSDKRLEAIKLIDKHRNIALLDCIPVLTAGYRDVEFKDGHVSHDEINNIYREVLSLAGTIEASSHKSDPSLVDGIRFALQQAVVKLFNHLADVTGNGKKKIIRGKWASRVITGTTRNVITASYPSGRFANNPDDIGYNDSFIGLFQSLVANGPFCVKAISESFLQEKFRSPLEPVSLVNKKSFKEEIVTVGNEWHSLFQSKEGIKKLIQRFRPVGVAHRSVEIEGRYLALVYKDEKGGFRILNSITELPAGLDKNFVTPMTFIELLYVCCYNELEEIPAYMCRYPATGIESNVPCFTKTLTTTKSEKRYWLDENFERIEDVPEMKRFPIRDSLPVTSMAPPIAALGKMDGDHDGDMLNYVSVHTKEARDEIRQYKKEKRAYVTQDGQLRYPLDYDTLNFICHNLSGVEV